MFKKAITIGALAAFTTIFSTQQAHAVQCVTTSLPGRIPAAKLVYVSEDSTVTSTFCNGTAGYMSDTYLVHPSFQYLGTGNLTASGSTVDMGFFAEGTELVFAIFVRKTSKTYYTGPGSRNSDGKVHAAVTDLGGGLYHVGFDVQFTANTRKARSHAVASTTSTCATPNRINVVPNWRSTMFTAP